MKTFQTNLFSKALVLFLAICMLGLVGNSFARDNSKRHKSKPMQREKIDVEKIDVKIISIQVFESKFCFPMNLSCGAPKPISDAKVSVWSSPFGINGIYISGKTNIDGKFIAAVAPDKSYSVKAEKVCYQTKSFDTDSDEVNITLKKICDVNNMGNTSGTVSNPTNNLSISFMKKYEHYDVCTESMDGNLCMSSNGSPLICTRISRSPEVKEFRCLNQEESTALNNFLYGLPNPETELGKIKSIPGITGAGCIIDADCMSGLKCTHIFGSGKPKICLSPEYDEWEFAYITSRETQRLVADSVCGILDTYSDMEPFGTSFKYEPQFSYFMDKVVENYNTDELVYEQTLMENWDNWDKTFTFRCPRLLDEKYVKDKICATGISNFFFGSADCPLVPINPTIFPMFRFDIENMALTYVSNYIINSDCGIYSSFGGSGLWNDSIQAFLNGDEPKVMLPGIGIGSYPSVCVNPLGYNDEKDSIDSKGSNLESYNGQTFPYWWYWGN
ncbi:hypothetical protein KKA47_03045 [bacterium]|nr:hypothetical protein [bacterium]